MSSNSEQLQEIIDGLTLPQKKLPSKYFYDEKGSILFDQICELEEYYPTRTELEIMNNNILDIVKIFDEDTLFIEFGSGSSLKTKLILDNVDSLAGYIPIDISEEHLLKSAQNLKKAYPHFEIIPLAADYTHPIEFPPIHHKVDRKITYFPGSTIGNFETEESIEFLKMVAEETGEGGGLLIGIDMIKEEKILEAAYNDSKGITAEFNLNILDNINELFGADFNRNKFVHKAIYNTEKARIEMHLIAKEKHVVHIGNYDFSFEENESVLTEYSHKFSLNHFEDLCKGVFKIEKVWTDDKKYFSILYLSVV